MLGTMLAVACASLEEGVPSPGVAEGTTGAAEEPAAPERDEAADESTGGGASTGAGDDTSDGSSSSGEAAEPGALTPMPIDEKHVRVEAGQTRDAELVERLPVGTSENAAKRRVVLRLSPQELPDLEVGDRLIAAAEVQVTTRCDVGQSAPGCDYNPKVRGQLILTGNADDVDAGGAESVALSSVQTQTCTKNEHHCMFVFRPHDATRTIGAELPCVATGTCRVNLVMWAWRGKARPDGKDKVLVGGNDGNYLENGKVDGDKARLMVVRERGIEAADRHERETTGQGSKNVPTTTAPVLVYSHRLKQGGLRAGEQFLVEAKIVARVGGRARFSTKMFVTKNADAVDGGAPDAIVPKQIGEHNGVNCLPGKDCVTRKVAVFRVKEDLAGPVYVNVVVKSAVPGGGSTNVSVRRDAGWVRSTRWEADHEG